MSHFNVNWIKEYLEIEPKVVFDIGSYDGKCGLKIKNKYLNATVISIEADFGLFSKMKNNGKLSKIEILNYAVCDIDGVVKFHHNSGHKKGSGSINKPTDRIFKFEGMSFYDPEEVPSIKMKTLCENLKIKEIDILHMDVQSAEYEVLCGLEQIRPKMIFLEISALKFYENSKSTNDKLIEMGYINIDIKDVTKGDELWLYKNNN